MVAGAGKEIPKGEVQDPRNLICDCRKIDTYLEQMTLQTLDLEVFAVVKKFDERHLKASEMRRQHLTKCLRIAKDQQDEGTAKDILQILHQEADKNHWRRVNRLVGDPRCSQVLQVKVSGEDGGTEEFSTKSGVYAAAKKYSPEPFLFSFHGTIMFWTII